MSEPEESTQVEPKNLDIESPKYIKRLLLIQPFTIEGVTEQSLYNHKGFKMTYHFDGIEGEFKNIKFKIPLSNVICAFY